MSEITINLRGLTEDSRDKIKQILDETLIMIPDEINQEASNKINAFDEFNEDFVS